MRETVEVEKRGFKVVTVFDISSTEGKELPTLGVDELTGAVEQYPAFMEALKKICPVPITFEDIESGAKGYYHQLEQRIAIKSGMLLVGLAEPALDIDEMFLNELKKLYDKSSATFKAAPSAPDPQVRL